MATDPICGMYVDERTAELVLTRENRTYYFCATACLEEFAAPERQLLRLRRRLAIAWPAAAVVASLTYLQPFPGWPWWAFGLAAVVQAYPGYPFYRGTYDAIRSRIWNMDILIAVGTTVAFLYSAAALLLPTRLPAEYFFDASALIVTLILTGNYLEHLTRERARGALRALRELLPSTAIRVADGRESEVPVAELGPHDRVRVRPGGRFPTDGIVRDGRSTVNEALLTGESVPVAKAPGDRVLAGAINGEGALIVETTGLGPDTLVAQIGQLVAEAETSRVPLQQLADRIASVFVPLVLLLAVLAAFGWLLLGVGVTVALLVFVSVAITACPCAFGIATPAAIVVGTGRAAEEGILFKGRDALERASRIDIVLTDKTGTLTRGRPTLTDVIPAPGTAPRDLLALSAGLERGSEHPFARAVVDRALREGIDPEPVDALIAEPGRGVSGRSKGVAVSVTRGAADSGTPVDLGALSGEVGRLEAEGKSWSVVRVEGKALGLLASTDPPAAGVREGIGALARDAIPVVMVTGDRRAAAERLAAEVGIREVHAEVRPEGKLALIRELQAGGRRVAFVGDGINDAPALAAADLGIAIGAGTDVAKEAGGIVLVRSDFRGVPLALRLGRRTVRKVRGNLTWALGYNAVLLPIAAGALVPVLGLGVFDLLPITGALAMGLSSTSVVLNSLGLRYVTLGP